MRNLPHPGESSHVGGKVVNVETPLTRPFAAGLGRVDIYSRASTAATTQTNAA